MEQTRLPEHMVFGLDIGTRSIVGSVGYLERDKFKVVAHCVKEHDTRAMMDGQIHDIQKVGSSISYVKNQLERQLGRELHEVCIAAAGRVLKTVTVHVDMEFEQEEAVDGEKIYSLELSGIEKAYEEIHKEQGDISFFCVGYTVVKYYLNHYMIGNLEGHKAKSISADVLATFLPDEVVEDLYTSVQMAGLEVANLTLEPIAAINVAIPQQYRLLNIALVDVGAGTSDICITKDGSIVAYGMIPHAGDEITEALVKKYLVDFDTAEKIKLGAGKSRQISFKDIMRLPQKVSPQEVRTACKPIVDMIAKETGEKIKELNGGKSVSAVFVVGGGGKVFGFTKALAGYLKLSEARVALRGEEVLGDVTFVQDEIKKDPLLVTPIGICMNFYDQKNNFIFVSINGERIKLYDNNKLTVVDAAIQVGYPNEWLFPRRGQELTFYVDGKARMIRGMFGEPAEITINGKKSNMYSSINKNDIITITESTIGEPASCTLEKLPEYKADIRFHINGKNVVCPKFTHVNGVLQPGTYQIQTQDNIIFLDYYTVEQLMTFLDIDMSDIAVYVNNQLAEENDKVYENFDVLWKQKEYKDLAQAEPEDIHKELDLEEKTEEENIESHKDYNSKMEDETGTAQQHKEEEKKEKETEKEAVKKGITVWVNEEQIELKPKEQYRIVDILDVYPFDVEQAAGRKLRLLQNETETNFSEFLHENDRIVLGWHE